MTKNYQGKLIFLERREVRYLVGMFGFLKGNCLIVLLLPPSPLLTSTSSAISTDTDEFLANLVVKLVPLPTSASSAMSNGKFLAD